MLAALVGPANYTATTMQQLAGEFGLQNLINKSVCVVPDALLSGRTDSVVAVERLKAISGADIVSVNRKNKDFWIGQLGVRFCIRLE